MWVNTVDADLLKPKKMSVVKLAINTKGFFRLACLLACLLSFHLLQDESCCRRRHCCWTASNAVDCDQEGLVRSIIFEATAKAGGMGYGGMGRCLAFRPCLYVTGTFACLKRFRC
jgi:hypothetical protein